MTDNLHIQRIQANDDLAQLCKQTRPELWSAANEMVQFEPAALQAFLENAMNWLVIAWVGDKVAAIAICYELAHPTGEETSLYVHELDTRPDYLRKGIGTNLMQWLQETAQTMGMSEVWLCTETDNLPANSLYVSLQPDETSSTTLYSYHAPISSRRNRTTS